MLTKEDIIEKLKGKYIDKQLLAKEIKRIAKENDNLEVLDFIISISQIIDTIDSTTNSALSVNILKDDLKYEKALMKIIVLTSGIKCHEDILYFLVNKIEARNFTKNDLEFLVNKL